jgi:membrane protein implicated in regulation of membrane protease activity
VTILVAILLALFVVPEPWGWPLVGAAVVWEVGSGWYQWHWSRTRRHVVGPAALVGATAEVTEPCRPDGWVRVGNELWRARCIAGANEGETVRVEAVDGMTLRVDRISPNPPS